MDLNIPQNEQDYLKQKFSDLSFDVSRIDDIENTATFSFKESDKEFGGPACDVKNIQTFCRKFGYSVLVIIENGARTSIQISKKPSWRTSLICFYVLLALSAVFVAVYEWRFMSALLQIIVISFVVVVAVFIGTRRLSEYFRDKMLDSDEKKRRVKFMGASEIHRVELLNAVNDQLFSAQNNRFGILTTIAIVAAAMLIAATFQGDMTPSLKTFASILMVAIAISLYAYAAKIEQLIKRAERFYMNVYTLQLRKPQYNPFRFSKRSRPRSIPEKIFIVIDELPVVLSIAVAVSVLDIIVIVWFFPYLI